ncbi:MAG: MOSC domain-containing protein [Planctomycetota bacterium]
MAQPTPSIISVNVGQVREVQDNGRTVRTGIYKSPVEGSVKAEGHNLHGDAQADLTVHGGPDKAIYGFASEHYDQWRADYPNIEFTWGAFGENLTTTGLLEDDALIGARYRCGSVVLRVTEPRMPCSKFALRLGDKSVLKHMLATGHSGFYFAIDEEGELQAGDALKHLDTPEGAIPVSTITKLYASKERDPAAIESVLAAPAITKEWSEWLEEQLKN